MIESLEPRIAPATVSVAAALRTATWTDFDGDKVTLKWTTGDAPVFTTVDAGPADGLIVKRIIFGTSNTGARVTIAVKAAGGGDGRIDLGRVDATGVGLASWSSPRATIAEIDAGDGTVSFRTFTSAGLGVQPFGLFPNSSGDGVSRIDGKVGTFTVRGDIGATKLQFAAPLGTKIAKIDIKGDLLGSAPNSPANIGSSGVIEIDGADEVTSIVIGGSIIGGRTANTGLLQCFTSIASLTIKGGIIGGDATNTGVASLGSVKTITVGGNLQGGTADSTGTLTGGDVTSSLTLGGSVIGGAVPGTAVIAFIKAGKVLIKGSIIGTAEIANGANKPSAALLLSGAVGSVTLGGDLLGGSNGAGASISYNGALLFGENVGSVTVKGSIRGTDGLSAVILAKGATPVQPGNFNAIGKLAIGGSVSLATIAAGHEYDLTTLAARIGSAENPDAGIGSVTVGGDWRHSNLIAGISDANSNGVDATDTRATGDATRQAGIGAIVIKGDLLNNGALAGTSGFAAEKIASITAGGQKVFSTAGPDKPLSWDGRVSVRQI